MCWYNSQEQLKEMGLQKAPHLRQNARTISETESTTPDRKGPITKLIWEEFLEIHYYTGGIARYLCSYVIDGNHSVAFQEVKRHDGFYTARWK